jgi:hypothetical protein
VKEESDKGMRGNREPYTLKKKGREGVGGEEKRYSGDGFTCTRMRE